MRPKIVRFKHDAGMYLLMSNNVIEECAYMYELTYEDIVLFLWVHYLNKAVLQKEYYSITKISQMMDDLRLELSHGNIRITKVLDKMVKRGFVEKVGAHYMTAEEKNELLSSMVQRFSAKIAWLEGAVEHDLKVKFRRVQKRLNPRPRGRPKGYSQRKHKFLVKYTCRVPFKSKTNKLFKDGE